MEQHGAATVVRDQFEAVNRRDWRAAMSAYADDVVLVVPDSWLTGGTYRGRERVGQWFGDWMRTFRAGIHFEIREIRESGGQVALWAHHIARADQSGVELEDDFFYHYGVRDGEVAFVRFCATWSEALEAAGAVAPKDA